MPGREGQGGGLGLPWCRLWNGAARDLKLLVLARRSGQPVPVVAHVWMAMLCHASEAARGERGTLDGWEDAEIAAFMGVDDAAVAAIREAMEGVFLEDGRIIAWERRQGGADERRPAATAAERMRAYRARKAAARAGGVTAGVTGDVTGVTDDVTRDEKVTRLRLDRESESESEKEPPSLPDGSEGRVQGGDAGGSSPPAPSAAADGGRVVSIQDSGGKRGHRLPDDWAPTREHEAIAAELFVDVGACARAFRDYWTAEGGQRARKVDWNAAFRVWLRREGERRQGGPRGMDAQQRRVTDLRLAAAFMDRIEEANHE